MKFLLATVLILLSFTFLSAQNEGNIWMIGNGGSSLCNKMGIDFNSGQADTFSLCRDMNFFTTNSSICDTSGSLVLYSNGYDISDGNHQPITNSSGFNPSQTNPAQIRLNIRQGTLILPVPGSDSSYYMFHVNAEEIPTNGNDFQPLELRYTLIHMQPSFGTGFINLNHKNISIYQDTLTLGRITATKHANGKDWWLVTHTYWSNEYLVFHVKSDTIVGPRKVKVGSRVRFDTIGKCVFSQDGKTLVMTGFDEFIDIFHFNRCTGNITLIETIKYSEPYMSIDSLLFTDCAISSNNRYLYANNSFYLYQFDLYADTIANSKIKIATWDGLLSPSSTCFNDMRLAPDDNIYMSTCQGTNRMHVIHNPNLADTLCNFEQNLLLPGYNANVWPNHVNYSLDSLTTSYCDSIVALNLPQSTIIKESIIVYPNPANGIVSFKLINPAKQIQEIEIYSYVGTLIDIVQNVNTNHYTYIKKLASGLYFYRIQSTEREFYTGKIIFE